MEQTSLTCQVVREGLLECDWTADQRERMLALLAHASECRSCAAAMQEFDSIRAVLQPATSTPEPTGGWERFEQDLQTVCAASMRPARLWRGWALAASLAVAAVGWGLYGLGARQTGPTSRAAGNGDLAALQITPQEAQQQANVFQEVTQAFDQRTTWMLLSDRQTGLGLADDPVDAPRRLILLRLTVLRADTVISSADLVVVPGQTAQLDVPFEPAQQLHYVIGTSSGDQTSLSIWAEVRKPDGGHETLAALATNLQAQVGKVLDAGQLVTSTGKYQFKIVYSQVALPERTR
jgi:hypothetical protein